MIAACHAAGSRSAETAEQRIDPFDAGPPPAQRAAAEPPGPSTMDAPNPRAGAVFDAKTRRCAIEEVEAFCASGGGPRACPTFSESWSTKDAVTTGKCSPAGAAGGGLRQEMGRCGAGHYVAMNGGFSGNTMYFDAKGKLFAASDWSDYAQYCEHQSFSIHYGPRPNCKEEPIQKVCPARNDSF